MSITASSTAPSYLGTPSSVIHHGSYAKFTHHVSQYRQEYWPGNRQFLAGYASGVSLVLVGHSFDTVKVRMQTEGSGAGGRFNGVLDCVKSTVQKEGVRGLYKGALAPILTTGVINSVLFGTQFNLVTRIKKNEVATTAEVMQAAVVSGALISVLVTPMEGVKARLQVQYGKGYTGPVDCARHVIQKLGVRNGLYRGWLPAALSRMSNYSYFGSYVVIQSILGKVCYGAEGALNADGTSRKLPVAYSILSGGLAGFCYWLSCYPMDVVKNRIMAAPDTQTPQYTNMRHAFRTIYQREGLKGFFVGFTPCVLRAFPANAAAFVGFEMTLRLLPE
ncbi:hypothetical protein SARC_08566 [Sphaeroforma arctica JP610]|uniref:Uncharacterized protein n=1 Tax=Sphaeroforma arctica JP610 TaxID=667725 RepID=A0A0L0FQG3_9EUKA|nr:hypothetical protein SARC_08566 [Sphaeroforma arctica JP610]KNC79025.1 hypothetical protein SARC_08566 [Sphaeroforma arctica JP610]|eukprot:XP_014152927.1 hypothetical protein SARC_08566 [Sphaeroforma arctica JP610]